MSELGERISFARQLGHMEGRINALERKVDVFEQRIESKLGAIEGKIDQLTTILNLGRGGWKALVMLGTFIGALMAVLKWLIDHAVLRLSGGP